jgi:hypothetical protein
MGGLGDREPHYTRIIARVPGRLDHVGSLGHLLGVMRGYQQERAHAFKGRSQALRLEEIAVNGLYAPISHCPSLRLVADERARAGVRGAQVVEYRASDGARRLGDQDFPSIRHRRLILHRFVRR